MQRTHIEAGSIALASIVSGPTFLIGMILSGVATDAGPEMSPDMLGVGLAMIMPSAFFGFFLSIIPNLLGSIAMT